MLSFSMKRATLIVAFLLTTLHGSLHAQTNPEKLQKDGNYREAFNGFRKRLETSKSSEPAKDLDLGIQCLQSLNQLQDADVFLEESIQRYALDWKVLAKAATLYSQIPHHGVILDSVFVRGNHRGGGTYINAQERDRVRSMQLVVQTMTRIPQNADVESLGSFYSEAANRLQNTRAAWQLQILTDLSSLPDLDDGRYGYHGGSGQGAPVQPDGSPVLYETPTSWETSKNDGERWRYLLGKASSTDPSQAGSAAMRYAQFLQQQFGVHTMRQRFGDWFDREDQTENVWSLHTLKETETLCQLVTGSKRITLPDDANHLKWLQRIATETQFKSHAEQASDQLPRIYANRRQFPQAARAWKASISKFGEGRDNWRRKQVEQIEQAWGKFDGTLGFPAGKPASLGFVYRNGTKVTLRAFEVKTEALLKSVKDFLRKNPSDSNREEVRLNRIGYQLISESWMKYVGKEVARWEETLTPKSNHWDTRADIETPLTKAGGYLVRATMADGHESNIVVWLHDTAILKKPLNGETYYYVADAINGQPVAKANVEFFGYKRERSEKKRFLSRRRYDIITKQFAEFTDTNGQVILSEAQSKGYQWLATVRSDDGRFAYHGFSSTWRNRHDADYKQTKTLFVTDRPVYRPEQEVQFHAWVRHAQYDQDKVSQFANQTFKLILTNPQGEEILKKDITTDAYGGFSETHSLPKGAALGVYRLHLENVRGSEGGNSFRVEEYKKPEFEVSVEAPDDPIMLGDAITAKIKANYYFGAPVTKATVKYKVMRTPADDRWYAPMPWDWFYGTGYWWFTPDYEWYPGWRRWGCRCPEPSWGRSYPPPELIAEREVPIGADGTVAFEIDTKLTKAIHGDQDHRYEITAEVRDESRRTIVGTGKVSVAREPFQVNVWVNRGHYRAGETIQANSCARTIDGKPVSGKGTLTLYNVIYDEEGKPQETAVDTWDLETDEEGCVQQQLTAAKWGQYRLSFALTDTKGRQREGAYLFVVRGDGFDGKSYHFNDLEIVANQREYAPGDDVELMVNTDKEGAVVLLFVRPSNGTYLRPEILRKTGKSTVFKIPVATKDMPNFFVEAVTVSRGKVHTETREIVVPPATRVAEIEVLPNKETYKPGESAKITLQIRDHLGKPFTGATIVSVYDKAIEYVSGGSNTPDIREFFWKWRRQHQPQIEDSVNLRFEAGLRKGKAAMQTLGAFGGELSRPTSRSYGFGERLMKRGAMKAEMMVAESDAMPAPMAAASPVAAGLRTGSALSDDEGSPLVEPTARSNFADTAYWSATLVTDADGRVDLDIPMPENLTTWKIKSWSMGHGTIVGQGETEVITSKDLLLRMQAPRFFTERDEVVLSANVHNYLDAAKPVTVSIELGGETLTLLPDVSSSQVVEISAGGEQRIDWPVRAQHEGEAFITMKALTDVESDAMEMRYPVQVHGVPKTDSWSGIIRPNETRDEIVIDVPEQRRPEASQLTVRYSPSIATAMVDALPYLVNYPYGCTEQTLNRFVPTVITQRILKDMNVDLAAVKAKRTNLSLQELGNAQERAKQWQRYEENPVYDEAEVTNMVKEGLLALTSMQNRDGGWGWFSGDQERSYPHTTAVIVHGLQRAKQSDVALVEGMIGRGISWLANYQKGEVAKIKRWGSKLPDVKMKEFADDLDALVFMTLVDAEKENTSMRDFLYRDRNKLSVYAKSMLGIAMHRLDQFNERDMLLRNIEQFLKHDDENQTAYLDLGNGSYWWRWYGSEYEAHAYYLKLLALVKPKSDEARGLVKYLLNNRKHGSRWNSTRDTAICVEAMADYLKASDEDQPNMTVTLSLDGEKQKEVTITPETLFTFDGTFTLSGSEVTTGNHTVSLTKSGKGPLYHNTYLNIFSLEDHIPSAGLELRAERMFHRLTRVDTSKKVSGSSGQVIDQNIEKYERSLITPETELKSGDLVEVELILESKNDYEYLIIKDRKPAGFEPVDVRSGYARNGLRVYREFRDDHVAFFAQQLARGKHTLTYRVRAEVPGKFSALPASISGMYAPELQGNSEEIKLQIVD